ncbi:hypothetical protein QBC39DRAFT_340124 [Podospora conica]|nr:hypothetical protein QBC39DRAFT_340124 [Schizothecium conicum]
MWKQTWNKKLFGNSVLGNSYGSGPSGGKGLSGDVNPVATIGSMPKKKKSKAASHFDTLNDDDSKYIILEERYNLIALQPQFLVSSQGSRRCQLY